MNEPMKIYDGGSETQDAWKETKDLNGFHPLFTADARRSIVLHALKLWLLLGFAVGAVTGFVLCGVAGAALLGAFIAAIIYFGYRNDVYKKIYGPAHDRGRLGLPEGMSWEEAVDRIRRGFANPDVEQVTDTPDTVTFHSRKCGTYQLQNTAGGLKMTILAKPSRSGKKEYLYDVFSSVLLSQVIALLCPQQISAAQVEEEKTAVRKLFRMHKMPFLIELAFGAAFLVFTGITLYQGLYSDTAKSKGISDSHLNAFPETATVGEVLDDFFANGRWDNFRQDGATYVRYIGEGTNTKTGDRIVIGIYFKLKDDGTSEIDHMTWNGDSMGTLEQLGMISALNDSYRKSHGLAASNTLDGAFDSAFDELENALNQAWEDGTSEETEPESTAQSESLPAVDDGKQEAAQPASRTDEQTTGTNGEDSYSQLAGEISANHNDYDFLTESEKEYYLSYGSQFRTAWLNAMYTDVEEDSGRYGDAVALEDFVNYMEFYSVVTSYSETGTETAGMMHDFYNVLYGMEDRVYLDTATDSEAAPFVEEVLRLAEAYGAEWQGW